MSSYHFNKTEMENYTQAIKRKTGLMQKDFVLISNNEKLLKISFYSFLHAAMLFPQSNVMFRKS